MIDRLFTVACGAGAAIALGVLVTVIALVIARGAPSLSWSFLTKSVEGAGASGGVVYQLLGTIILIATSVAVVLPPAVGVGIAHALYLSPRGRHFVETMLQALNGIPSIVFGLFGLALFVQWGGMRKSWLAGGILLGIMIVPTVAVAFLEKVRAIPPSVFETAFALGLRKSQVARSVVLRQGAAGLLTGTLLGVARAAGETAPVMFTAVIFAGATVPRGVVDSPVLALPYHIFVLAQDTFDPAATANMWGSATVLLLLVSVLSLIALPLRLRVHEEARRV